MRERPSGSSARSSRRNRGPEHSRDIADKASIEALAQKKIADNQKQLAVENASKADESARKAELRLAEGLISQADALSLAGRFAEAHSLYTEAYDKFAELKAPLTAAEVGLWSSYHQTAFPLLSFTGHSGEVTSVAICPGRPNRDSRELRQDAEALGLWPPEESCAPSPGTPTG